MSGRVFFVSTSSEAYPNKFANQRQRRKAPAKIPYPRVKPSARQVRRSHSFRTDISSSIPPHHSPVPSLSLSTSLLGSSLLTIGSEDAVNPTARLDTPAESTPDGMSKFCIFPAAPCPNDKLFAPSELYDRFVPPTPVSLATTGAAPTPTLYISSPSLGTDTESKLSQHDFEDIGFDLTSHIDADFWKNVMEAAIYETTPEAARSEEYNILDGVNLELDIDALGDSGIDWNIMDFASPEVVTANAVEIGEGKLSYA